jgi:hypothetical protein
LHSVAGLCPKETPGPKIPETGMTTSRTGLMKCSLPVFSTHPYQKKLIPPLIYSRLHLINP